MPSQDNFNEFFQILEQKAYTDEDIQYLIQELIQLYEIQKFLLQIVALHRSID